MKFLADEMLGDVAGWLRILGFDTTYSYNISTSSPYSIYDVSFYKNPSTLTYTGYTQKTYWTLTTWNGQNYQQFWTANYQGALWTTKNICLPRIY